MENKSIDDLVKSLPEYFIFNGNKRRNVGMGYYSLKFSQVIESMPEYRHLLDFSILQYSDRIYKNIKDIPYDENAPDIYTEQCHGETDRFRQSYYLARQLSSLPEYKSKMLWFHPDNWERTCEQIKTCTDTHKIESRDPDCWVCALTAEFYWEQNEKDEIKHVRHLSKDILYDESCLLCIKRQISITIFSCPTFDINST